MELTALFDDVMEPVSELSSMQMEWAEEVREMCIRDRGTLITTGFMNQKKAFYVIPEMAELPVSEWIPIAPQDIDSFKDVYKRQDTHSVLFKHLFK